MTNQIDALATNWITYRYKYSRDLDRRKAENGESIFSFGMDIFNLVQDDPELLWKVIVKITGGVPNNALRSDDEDCLGMLGAGPLEELISEKGEVFIERIEKEALSNFGLRYALRNAWQSTTSDHLWERIVRASGE